MHVFSSIGAFSLVYPSSEIWDYCVSEQAVKLAERLLGTGLTTDLQELSFKTTQLVEDVGLGNEIFKTLSPSKRSPTPFEKESKDIGGKDKSTAIDYARSAEQEIIKRFDEFEVEESIRQSSKEFLDSARDKLDKRLAEIAASTGTDYTESLINRVERRLDLRKTEIQTEADSSNNTQKDIQGAFDRHLGQYEKRGGKEEDLKGAFDVLHDRQWYQHRKKAAESAKTICCELRKFLRDEVTPNLDAIEAKLEESHDAMEESSGRSEKSLRQLHEDRGVILSVVGQEHARELYEERHDKDLTERCKNFWKDLGGTVSGVGGKARSDQEIQRACKKAASEDSPFEDVWKVNVVDFLANMGQGEGQRYWAYLSTATSPWLKFSTDMSARGGKERRSYLAVPSENGLVPRNLFPGMTSSERARHTESMPSVSSTVSRSALSTIISS